MVKSKKIDDGSKDGALGYYCECGKCGPRDVKFSKELAEKVEEIHLQKRDIHKEYMDKMDLLGRKEARLVGIGWMQRQEDGSWITMDIDGSVHELRDGTVMDEVIGVVKENGELVLQR